MAINLVRAVPLSLDYYLVPGGIVVEEFVLAGDGWTIPLRAAAWSAGTGWSGRAELSRAMRVDAQLRAQVRPVERPEAEREYARLGGGELPDEVTLRRYLGDPLPTAEPLRLGEPADDRRQYRILFANDLDGAALARVRSAHPSLAGGRFTWELRRIGPGIAWGLDLTARSRADGEIARVLRVLLAAMRRQGLIPVTVERFA
jgi:hypothetical protein